MWRKSSQLAMRVPVAIVAEGQPVAVVQPQIWVRGVWPDVMGMEPLSLSASLAGVSVSALHPTSPRLPIDGHSPFCADAALPVVVRRACDCGVFTEGYGQRLAVSQRLAHAHLCLRDAFAMVCGELVAASIVTVAVVERLALVGAVHRARLARQWRLCAAATLAQAARIGWLWGFGPSVVAEPELGLVVAVPVASNQRQAATARTQHTSFYNGASRAA